MATLVRAAPTVNESPIATVYPLAVSVLLFTVKTVVPMPAVEPAEEVKEVIEEVVPVEVPMEIPVEAPEDLPQSEEVVD